MCTRVCAHELAHLHIKQQMPWSWNYSSCEPLRSQAKPSGGAVSAISLGSRLEFCGDFHESVESFGQQVSSIVILPIHECGRAFGFLLFSSVSLFCVSKFYLCWPSLCLDLFPEKLQKGTIPTQRGQFSFSEVDSLSLMSAFPQYLVFKKTLISILEKQ